jgi:predicted nucleotidyltransferase
VGKLGLAGRSVDSVAFEAWARARGVGAVWLFGSAARGSAGPDSDIDLALWLQRGGDWEAREMVREEAAPLLAEALHVPIERLDVTVLDDESPLAFIYRVLQCRCCLWEGDHAARIEWQVEKIREYLDFQYFEDIHHAAMLRQLEEGTYGRRSTNDPPPAA